MRKDNHKLPSVDRHQYYVKNPIVYNKKFDFELNPITNWVDPLWLQGQDIAPEQEWFRLANEGREDQIWSCYYFKTHRRHKGYWCWVPFESMGRTEDEARQGLLAAVRINTPLLSSDKMEFDLLMVDIMQIDREYYANH